jgi:hypothetical protein
VANARRQKPTRCCLGNQRQVDERCHQARILGQENQVAMRQHGRSNPDSIALNRRDQRLVGLAEIADETIGLARTMIAGRCSGEIGEIVSGRKTVAVPLKQNHAYRRIVLRAFKPVGHGAVHSVAQRILLVRPRQRQCHDAFGNIRLYMLAHRFSSLYRSWSKLIESSARASR